MVAFIFNHAHVIRLFDELCETASVFFNCSEEAFERIRKQKPEEKQL